MVTAPRSHKPWMGYAIFAVVCALVIGIFAWSARSGVIEFVNSNPASGYYNLLVQGFRAGQLNLNREAAPELAQLADPYDPARNASFVWNERYFSYESSYYKGKLYLYFGVTPALVLFWPYVVLTGHYLLHKNAVVIFFALGFLVSAGLLRAIWRRYFPAASVWVAVAGLLALGLATGLLEILSRCDVYEVAMSSGFAFSMLALAGIWGALHEQKREIFWLSLASLAYGLAIGSRPSLLFGAIILLVPVARAWHEAGKPKPYRRVGWLLLAAVIPVMLIGLGLMVYNDLRFDNPFEFGWHYQLTTDRQVAAQQFSLNYLWINFRFYFLEPMGWSGHFPFLQAISLSPLPSGYYGVGEPYSGTLSNYPVVWLALASLLAWRGRPEKAVSALRWFMGAVFLLFAICALTLCLFFSASCRYQLDFLPALMLLAVTGIFALEGALRSRPVWRRIARCGWCGLLVYSIAFNVLASVEAHAAANFFIGNTLFNRGMMDEAEEYYKKALALQPESATFHNGLGFYLFHEGRVDEAIVQYQKAQTLQPESDDAYVYLSTAFLVEGRVDDAMVECQQALKIKPDSAGVHNNLGYCLVKKGRLNEAVVEFQRALEITPELATARNALGDIFLRTGRVTEAIPQFQKALEIQPDFAEAQYNLGDSLLRIGRVDEAITNFQKSLQSQQNSLTCYKLGCAFRQKRMAKEAIASFRTAIKLQPQFIFVQRELAWMLATWPESSVRNGEEAVALAEQANQLSKTNDPSILRALAAAYAETGRFPEALKTARRALELATARSDKRLVDALQTETGLYQTNSPCRSISE